MRDEIKEKETDHAKTDRITGNIFRSEVMFRDELNGTETAIINTASLICVSSFT